MCPYGTDKYKSTILSRTCYIRLRGAVSALRDRREVPNRSGWPMCGGGRFWRHADYLSALDTGPMLNIRGPEAVTTVRPPRTDAPQSGHSKPTVRRDEVAARFRAFLEVCPTCGGELTEEVDAETGLPAIACAECGAALF